MGSTWDLEREIKKGEKINRDQRNVLKTRHCKLFALHSRLYAVRMCTSTLSGWKQHPLQSLCICSLHLKDTESFISNTIWGMQRAPERWRGERIAHILLRIIEGGHLWLSVSGLWWNLAERVSRTPSLLPLLQQKPIAFCFECLVATSPYLIPWVYNCSPACTCPKLPQAILSSPQLPFPHGHTSHWRLPLRVMIKSVNLFCFFSFLPHSFNIFFFFTCHARPSLPLRHCTYTPLWRPAQDRPWEWPALNIVVCWQQHGVMWMRPGDAQSGVYALNSCQMSL